MVEFCPECSSLLRKQINSGIFNLVCRCGYQQETQKNESEINKNVQEKKKSLDGNLIVVTEEDKITVNPKVSKVCPKCSHKEAEAWQEQTRSADEPSTSFFRCLKCRFTWREY